MKLFTVTIVITAAIGAMLAHLLATDPDASSDEPSLLDEMPVARLGMDNPGVPYEDGANGGFFYKVTSAASTSSE